MFECYGCNKGYENEEDAKNCCTRGVLHENGQFTPPRKFAIRPGMKSHSCPNVTHGGKEWQIWLKPEEKCPMCEFVYRPR